MKVFLAAGVAPCALAKPDQALAECRLAQFPVALSPEP